MVIFVKMSNLVSKYKNGKKARNILAPCTTHKTFGLNPRDIRGLFLVSVCTNKIHMETRWHNAYMISCAPINLYLWIKKSRRRCASMDD